MAIVFDNSSEAYFASAAGPVVIPHTSAGDHLTVGIISQQVALTVTYNGATLTQIAQGSTGGSNDTLATLFGIAAPAAGTHDVVITLGAASEGWAGVVSRTGVDQAAPSSGGAGDSQGSGRSGDVDVVSAAGDLVIGLAGTTSDDLASDAGQTTRAVKSPQVNNERNGLMDDEPGAALVNMAYTWRLNRFAVFAGASLKAATGGGGTELAASMAGTGGMSAGVQLTRILAASLAGTGGMAAAVQVTRQLSADMAGVGGAAVDLQVTRVLAASMAGVGGASVALQVTRQLAVSMAGTGGMSAELAVGGAVDLDVAMAGTGGMSAALQVNRTLAVDMAGQGDMAASLRITRRLAVSMAGTGGMVVSFTEPGGFATLESIRLSPAITVTNATISPGATMDASLSRAVDADAHIAPAATANAQLAPAVTANANLEQD